MTYETQTLSGNPRFAAYARATGMTCVDRLAQDRRDWPGGVMVGFIQWNTARLLDYSRINPAAFYMGHLTNHDAYDAWLAETYP